MFEHHSEPLASTALFLSRLARHVIWGWLIIVIALFVGMLGYHTFEHMTWIDAFVNASMILSGMGPLSPLVNNSSKIFAGLYALFSGLAFIMIIGVFFAPVVHRWLHKFHIIPKASSRN